MSVRLIIKFFLIALGPLAFAAEDKKFWIDPELRSIAIWNQDAQNQPVLAPLLVERLSQQLKLDSTYRLEKNQIEQQQAALKNLRGSSDSDQYWVENVLSKINLSQLIWLRIKSAEHGWKVQVQLYVAPKAYLLLDQEFTLKSASPESVNNWVMQVHEQIRKMRPFTGSLTSVQDDGTVVIDLGQSGNLKPGMVLPVVQISEIEVHPYLPVVQQIKVKPKGTVVLTKVEATLSFAKILELNDGISLQKGDHFQIPIIHRMVAVPGLKLEDTQAEQSSADNFLHGPDGEDLTTVAPSLGYARLSLGGGNFYGVDTVPLAGQPDVVPTTQTYSNPAYPALQANGQFWIDANIFLEGEVNFAALAIQREYGQAGTAAVKLNSSLNRYGMQIGYKYLLRGGYMGPYLAAAIGFSAQKFYIDTNAKVFDSFNSMVIAKTYSGATLTGSLHFPIMEDLGLIAKGSVMINPTLAIDIARTLIPAHFLSSSESKFFTAHFLLYYQLLSRVWIVTEYEWGQASSIFNKAYPAVNDQAEVAATNATTSYNYGSLMLGVQYYF